MSNITLKENIPMPHCMVWVSKYNLVFPNVKYFSQCEIFIKTAKTAMNYLIVPLQLVYYEHTN